jgi:tetratricopeptide (TPR) repeat protein/methylase of polypeptide subunit release factors
MREKKKYIKGMRYVLRKIQEEERKHEAEVLGKSFVVHPQVFSPRYYGETAFFARHLPVEQNDEFLEIGCGTGVISIFAALNGASRVVATDISPRAVENARENVRRHGLEDVVDVRHGDIYSCITEGERFDAIFWALPVAHIDRSREELSELERTVFDPNYEILDRFVGGARPFLKPEGRVLFGTSPTLGHIEKVKKIVGAHRFEMQLLEEITTLEVDRPVPAAWPIVWRLYEAVPVENPLGRFDRPVPGADLVVPTPEPPPSHFTGREEELTALAKVLTREVVPIIALQGMGGIGKTALAQKLAASLQDDFPGGVLWASLGPRPDVVAVLEMWARLAGGNVTKLSTTEQRATFVRSLLSKKRNRLLVVLDDAWEEKSTRLLIRKAIPAGCPILLTTRREDLAARLRCRSCELDALSEEEAMNLLAELVGPLEGYEAAAREMVSLVEGLPLAVEVAAGIARRPSSLPRLVGELSSTSGLDQLRLPGEETRESSVRRCLALSYETLDDEVKRCFRALGAFASGVPFDDAAAKSVWALDEKGTESMLATLTDLHLLRRVKGGESRFRQHMLLRDYALDLLEQEGDVITARRQHASYYFDLAKTGDWGEIETSFEQVRQGWETIKAHFADEAVECFMTVVEFLERQGRWTELETWGGYALQKTRAMGDLAAESRVLTRIGYVKWQRGSQFEAFELLKRSREAAEEIGSERELGDALNCLGLVYRGQSQWRRAEDCFHASLKIRTEKKDYRGMGFCLRNIAAISRLHGELIESLDYVRRSSEAFEKCDDWQGQGISVKDVGRILLLQGYYQKAMESFERSLELSERSGDKRLKGLAVDGIGNVCRAQGRYLEALDHYQRSLDILEEIGDYFGKRGGLFHIAHVYNRLGRSDDALASHQQGLYIAREAGEPVGETVGYNNLGCVYYTIKKHADARYFLERALAISREISYRIGEGRCLNNLGNILRTLENPEGALEYLENSLSIAQEIGSAPAQSIVLSNMGLTLSDVGECDQAIACFQRSLDIAQQIGDRDGEGVTLRNMAIVYEKTGEFQQAESMRHYAATAFGQCGIPEQKGARHWVD